MFTASAAGHSCQVDLKSVFKFHTSAPFIEIDESEIVKFDALGLSECNYIIYRLKNLAKALAEGLERIPPICERLEQAAKDGAEMIEKVKGEIQSSSMNYFQKAKSVKKLASNMQKLGNAPKIGQKLKEDMENIVKGIQNFSNWINTEQGITQIKEVGKQAAEAKCFDTSQIVLRFWPEKSELKTNKPQKKRSDLKDGKQKEGEQKKKEEQKKVEKKKGNDQKKDQKKEEQKVEMQKSGESKKEQKVEEQKIEVQKSGEQKQEQKVEEQKIEVQKSEEQKKEEIKPEQPKSEQKHEEHKGEHQKPSEQSEQPKKEESS